MDDAAGLVASILAWAAIGAGSICLIAGAVGVLRMPDVYTRMHAAGITDTGGAGLILIGLMFEAGFTLATVKLILILVFLFFTSPTSCHALANTAMHAGVKPLLGDGKGDRP